MNSRLCDYNSVSDITQRSLFDITNTIDVVAPCVNFYLRAKGREFDARSIRVIYIVPLEKMLSDKFSMQVVLLTHNGDCSQ